MTRRNLPIAAYLLLLFISGAVVGALGYRTYNPPIARSGGRSRLPPAEWRRQYIEEMKTRLSLSEDQLQKLGAILDETSARFQAAREQDNQVIRQIREDHFTHVRTILRPEQATEYEKLHAEREERAKRQEQNRR
jgi:hypothetical protein